MPVHGVHVYSISLLIDSCFLTQSVSIRSASRWKSIHHFLGNRGKRVMLHSGSVFCQFFFKSLKIIMLMWFLPGFQYRFNNEVRTVSPVSLLEGWTWVRYYITLHYKGFDLLKLAAEAATVTVIIVPSGRWGVTFTWPVSTELVLQLFSRGRQFVFPRWPAAPGAGWCYWIHFWRGRPRSSAASQVQDGGLVGRFSLAVPNWIGVNVFWYVFRWVYSLVVCVSQYIISPRQLLFSL